MGGSSFEIERKFLLKQIPDDLERYEHSSIEQGYLCTGPVVRIRKEDDEYYLTYKGKGQMIREEYNLPLTEKAYRHLRKKTDGILLRKTRYRIPLAAEEGCLPLTAEIDIFEAPYEGLCLAEVEFPDKSSAERFIPPEWFGEDVTFNKKYHNSNLSKGVGING